MSNLLDFQRLSNFVSGIVDRKIYAVSASITSGTGYLQGLVTSSQNYTNQSLAHSNTAANSASDADTAAASALIVWNEFTSTYVGLKASDPTLSSLGNSINVGAFYIRQADGRIRYASSVNNQGVPVWVDATVAADPNSILSAGQGVFLGLNILTAQTIKGPITFQGVLTGPRISSWTSQQLATAVDVNDRITTVNNAITAETTRATNAETTLTNNKVAKSGDTMSGPLAINAGGNNSLLRFKNTDANGRQWRFYSASNGTFYLGDESAGAERLYIDSSGRVTAPGMLVGGAGIATPTAYLNREDTNDPGLMYQFTGITRWIVGRSYSGQRFYIVRCNAQGVYQDTPLQINESDGAVTLNQTSVNGTLTTTSTIRNNSTGASLHLNNSSGNADPGVMLLNGGYQRWFIGRSASNSLLFINRHNSTGAWQETPFSIRESDGWVQVNNLVSASQLVSNGFINTPRVYATSNGDGRAVAVGDDVWLGDINMGNTVSIRGQSDFNAGYVSFGNSGYQLGCNTNDSNLRYGGNIVYHTGNLSLSPANLGFTSGSNEFGFWRKSPDNCIEQWGKLQHSASGEISVLQNFPIPFTNLSSVNISLTIVGAGGSWNDMWLQINKWDDVTLNYFIARYQSGSSGNWGYGYHWKAIGY